MRRMTAIAALATLLIVGGAAAATANGGDGRAGERRGPTPLHKGSWQRFWWAGGGRQYARNGPFTFSSETPTTLRLTDDFCRGDVFAVYDNGSLLGKTTPSQDTGFCNTLPPRRAWEDPSFSHGLFHLGPGDHSISLIVIQNPFQGGAAFLIETG